MASILPPAPVDAPFASYNWEDWYIKVRNAINNGAVVNLASGVTGVLAVGNGGTGVSASTGSVAVVLSNSPTLVTPNIGAATGTSLILSSTLKTTLVNLPRVSDGATAGSLGSLSGTAYSLKNGGGSTAEVKVDAGTILLQTGGAGGLSIDGAGVVTVGSSLVVTSAVLLKSNTTLTNGAGSSAGTLTTAPTAGPPTKWIQINDNGTIRSIPSW